MVFSRKDGIRVERVVFDGKTYALYPDSPNPAHRAYFSRTGHRLHRDVWVVHNGPIPAGCHVHHIDGDTSNNDIGNLQCVTRKEHWAMHAAERSASGRTPEHLEHLDRIRTKASAWHASDEGRAWHREASKESLRRAREHVRKFGFADVACTCAWCGASAVGKNTRKKFCSAKCQTAESKFRRGKSRTQHPYHAARV